MFCPQCGNNVKDDANFCTNCGCAVQKVERRCASCGTALKDGMKFCPKCGGAVTADSPAPVLPGTGAQKRMADFTQDEYVVGHYIGSKTGYKYGTLGRNDGISLTSWIEQYSDSKNGKGVHLYLYHPDEDNLCKLASIVVDNDDEFVAGCEWGMDYNDDKPIDILFGNGTDADRTEFDGEDCMHRYIPFV